LPNCTKQVALDTSCKCGWNQWSTNISPSVYYCMPSVFIIKINKLHNDMWQLKNILKIIKNNNNGSSSSNLNVFRLRHMG
jgi:hypothetical protein